MDREGRQQGSEAGGQPPGVHLGEPFAGCLNTEVAASDQETTLSCYGNRQDCATCGTGPPRTSEEPSCTELHGGQRRTVCSRGDSWWRLWKPDAGPGCTSLCPEPVLLRPQATPGTAQPLRQSPRVSGVGGFLAQW